MLLNISALILVLMLGIVPVALGALLYKSQNDNKWFVMHRGKIMIALWVGILTTITTMSICMYEINKIRDRLQDEIVEIQLQQGKY
ncbi:hypothetical protein [Pseudomonas phage D6]|nr:hypothetical protein [Pseudomonas phage D6]